MTSADRTSVHDPLTIVVLVSGSGTLLQSLIDHAGDSYRISAVIADVDCPGIERAHTHGIPATVVPFKDFTEREAWNQALATEVATTHPDLVVSAGFMRILSPTFLNHFPGRIINTHPALLPSFPGAHAVRDALAYGVKITGSTIHFVDEGVDTGPIIAQEAVRVDADDTEETLHEKIKQVERKLIVKVLEGASNQGRFISTP